MAPLATWALVLLTNVTALAATLCLYQALAVGRLALVAPVAATYGGVTALLANFSGSRLEGYSWLGLAAIVTGGVLVARPAGPSNVADGSRAGLFAAIAASLLYGISFWIQGTFVVPRLGILVPTWSYYLVGALTSWAFGILARRDMAPPQRSDMPIVAATTMLACGGTVCLAAGQGLGAVGVVTVLSALASGVTLLLGRLLLNERIALTGYLGFAMIAAGLATLHLAQSWSSQ